MRTVAALVFSIAVGACGSGDEADDEQGPFDVSGYDRSCSASSDCLLIYSGDPCGCDCDQSAIANAERASYSADRDAYVARTCPNGGLVCGPCPPSAGVGCVDGQCDIVP